MEVLLSIMLLYFRKTLFSQHATEAGWKETMHHVVTFLGRNTPWCWSDDFHQLQLCPKCIDGMIFQLANETIKINIIVARIQQSCPWPSCQKCNRYWSPPPVRRIICFASLYIALHSIAFHCTALLSIALHLPRASLSSGMHPRCRAHTLIWLTSLHSKYPQEKSPEILQACQKRSLWKFSYP